MPTTNVTTASLLEKINDYLETRLELFRLKTIDKSSDVLSSLVTFLAILLGMIILIFMLCIGLAIYLGEILGKTYYGFFAVGAFIGLLVFFIYVFRNKWIKSPVCNLILRKIFN